MSEKTEGSSSQGLKTGAPLGRIADITRGQIEIMVECRRGEQRIDDGRWVAGITAHSAADGAPAPDHRVRNGK